MKTLNKVLLIDDDSISNMVTQTMLKKLGVAREVQTALNGKEGLEIVQKDCLPTPAPSRPDLILLDINMPVMDGFEFLRKFDALESTAKPTIIMFTSSDNAEDKERTSKFENVVGYITKPFELKKLEAILGKLE